MRRFEGQTVVVTGASRGLGRAMAIAFGSEGAHVALGFRSREADAQEAARAVALAGGEAELLPFDVRDRAAVDAAVDRVLQSRGGIDVLVNNAAVSGGALFAAMDPAEWDDSIAVNLGGTFNCCRAVVRPMIARRRGAILNVASVAGLRAMPGLADYSASKGGVLAFTRTLAAELAPKGVRVNAIVPGVVDTGMTARVDRNVSERRRQAIPLGRFATEAEVTRAALFLASDDASYIIGQALVVDGGLSL